MSDELRPEIIQAVSKRSFWSNEIGHFLAILKLLIEYKVPTVAEIDAHTNDKLSSISKFLTHAEVPEHLKNRANL